MSVLTDMVMRLPLGISFARGAARAETEPPHQTSNGANEAGVNYPPSGALELSSQPTEIFTIEQLVRASIIDAKGDSEQDVHLNMFMARQWYGTMFDYPQYTQDRELIVWRIKSRIKEEHGYIVKTD